MGTNESKTQPKETRKQEALRLLNESRKRYMSKLLGEVKNENQTDIGKTFMTEHKEKMKSIDVKDYEYPFENLVFEGGGAKGASYIGAYNLLEECGIKKNIKRFSGTSMGAFMVLCFAVEATFDDIREYFGPNFSKRLVDNKYGFLSLIPNMISGYGWNPSLLFYNDMGKLIANKTNGNPDLTFLEFYNLTGKELCIVAANVNTMTEEYFHVKTTPKCPIRLAVRMSMTIPGVMQAPEIKKNKQSTVYVDGGLNCVYPIHCFDGWWLSMERDDSFLKRLTPLDKIPYLMNKNNRFRFDPTNNKTLGFVVYSEDEQDLNRFELDLIKREKVEYPDTELSRQSIEKGKEKKAEMKENNLVVKAVDAFLSAINKSNLCKHQTVEYEELKEALNENTFTLEYYNILFGEDTSLETIFNALDRDGSGSIDYQELHDFIESIGISLQERSTGFKREEINGMLSFFSQCISVLLTNTERLYFEKKDVKRTVGINTGYITGSATHSEDQDVEFLMESGRQATEDFLRNFVLENDLPKKVKTIDS